MSRHDRRRGPRGRARRAHHGARGRTGRPSRIRPGCLRRRPRAGRAGPEAIVETPKGSFTIRLLPDVAPKHVALFLETAKAGGYDGTTFHRVIMGGIIQGGDPLSKDPAKADQYGTGGLGLAEGRVLGPPLRAGHGGRRPPALERRQRRHPVLRLPTWSSPRSKGQYTVFGEVTSGMEVVDQISLTPATATRPPSESR